MTDSVLSVESVTKSYGKLRALDNLSLQINPGEFCALLGLNGAGKTTLFQLLTGLFTPDEGSIRVQGKDMRHSAVQALAQIGVVFQQPTLDLDLSIRANLKFHTRMHGMGRAADARIAEELERVGLSQRADDPVRELSGGNKRKVELVRALLHKPAILLMDEPTVGLDPGSRASLIEHVHKLCREQNMAVLWATHLVDEAESAQKVFVLHKGHLLAEQDPAGLCSEVGTSNLAAAFLQMTGAKSLEEEES